ncbi:uncharacterized protein LOC127148079, partial [Cucumis melo]|uniref:Uncharacterized protein LOC127148079 n=1 Tax=Cucumis melo TaxID=3656 RepID=A0ABM3KGF6_CUCME
MAESLPKTLPPLRGIDHEIELLPGARPPAKNAYHTGPPELAELVEFLDAGTYYLFGRKPTFLEGFSSRTGPLTELLKKDHKWELDPRISGCLRGSEEGHDGRAGSRNCRCKQSKWKPTHLILALVLQDGHPIAYESRKLKDAERRSRRERNACSGTLSESLETRFLGIPVRSQTDNRKICHFFSQPKLTSKQARWQECLAEFDFQKTGQ